MTAEGVAAVDNCIDDFLAKNPHCSCSLRDELLVYKNLDLYTRQLHCELYVFAMTVGFSRT